MKTLVLLMIAIFGTSATKAVPKYESWNCPIDLDVDPDQKLKSKIEGWETASIPNRYNFLLESVHVYHGHPSKLVNLKLVAIEKDRLMWERPFGDKSEYWLSCNYSDTSLMLFRKIPYAFKSCISTKVGHPAKIDFSCIKVR